MIAEANGYLVGASLPFIAVVAERTPPLRVLVIDSSEDPRLAEWLSMKRFVRLDPTSTLRSRLERLAEHERFERYLRLDTNPAPGMADGARGGPERVYVFDGPALVWIGSASDAQLVVDRVARGAWSVERLEQYEGIRLELFEYVKLADAGQREEARALARGILARADVQPSRLTDLAHAVTPFAQTRADVELARDLAQRAVRLTERLDAGILSAASTALLLAGDGVGSVAAAERVVELCKSMKSDCEGETLAWEQQRRCPSELVEAPSGNQSARSRFVLQPAKGAGEGCP